MHQRNALVANRVHVQSSQDIELYQEMLFSGNVQFVEQFSHFLQVMHQRNDLVANRVHVQSRQDIELYQEMLFSGNVQLVEQFSQRPLVYPPSYV